VGLVYDPCRPLEPHAGGGLLGIRTTLGIELFQPLYRITFHVGPGQALHPVWLRRSFLIFVAAMWGIFSRFT
jgi:hypothetical protein